MAKSPGRVIHLLRYSPDGRWVAFGDDKVYVANVASGEVRIFRRNKEDEGISLSSYLFVEEKGWLVSDGSLGFLTVWDVETGAKVFRLRGPRRISSMARVPGGETVLVGTDWSAVTTLDLKARSVAEKLLKPKLPEGELVGNLVLSEDGLALAIMAKGGIYLCEINELSAD